MANVIKESEARVVSRHLLTSLLVTFELILVLIEVIIQKCPMAAAFVVF